MFVVDFCINCAVIYFEVVLNTLSENHETKTKNPMQILEEALTVCKFGKFHIRMMIATLCSAFASMLVTTTASYILPVAECDLEMNMMYKGLLNAAPFLGQIGASLFTGFLVDAFGRKFFLVGGNLGIFICTIIEGLTQTYWMMIFIKVVQGVSLSLSFSAMSTNISEFCPLAVRDRILMFYSAFMSLGIMVAALMSWLILPYKFDIVIWPGYFELHAWNFYLYICSLWSLMAFIMYYHLPESPKYLLSHGQETEALNVLKTIYSENSGSDKDTFPILSFSTNGTLNPTLEISLKKQLVNALFEVKELFRPPLLYRLIFFSLITLFGLVTFTSLRLWFPQLSTMVENYDNENGGTARFCIMINKYMDNLKVTPANISNVVEKATCAPKLSGAQTYINGVILGALAMSIIIMIGRIGSLTGNILFPVLLGMGCMAPFLLSAIISSGIAILVYFLPNVSKENKETGDK